MSIATGWHIDHVATRRLPIAMGPTERSRHFSILIAVAALVLPLLTLLSGGAAYVPIAALPALMLIPALIFRPGRRPPGASDDDHDDGGDGGTPTPDKPNGLPGGGVPLPDAVHARIRYRGTARTSLIPSGERRREREPARRPLPSRVG